MRLWLDRYLRPLPIRSRGAFQLISATRADGGRPCVVIVPGPTASRARVDEAFAEVERVHALLDHPRIPRVAARGVAGEIPYLELDCDAVIDGVDVVCLLASAGEKLPYSAADAIIAGIRQALVSAHGTRDPRTGEPVCLGRLSYANVLLSRSGAWHLVGFGRNFPLETEEGVADGWVTAFQAIELSVGGAPSPMGDYVALLHFMRSLAPYVEISATVARLLRGDIRPGDLELLDHLRWFERNVFSAPPSERPTIDEAVAVSDRVRALLGEGPDPARFEAHIGSLLDRHGEPLALEDADAETEALVIGPEAAWLARPDGTRQRLGRSMRRIVLALLGKHREAPGEALAMWDLLEAGWPGERPIPAAGANRVYAAVARLRRMGMRDVIERFEDGYRIAPGASIQLAER